MKKTVLTLLGLCFALTIAMGQQDNWMHKYWNYRDRFHKYFTHMGTSPGDGLAAAHRMLRRFDDYAGGANGTNYYNGIKYGDAIADLGDYIAVLATEYKLLKDAGKDLTPVLNELYFALDAFERSDKEAEVYLSNGLQGENSNGFFMRGDVPANYHTIWNNEYANTNDEADLRLPGTDAPGHYTGEFSGYINDGNEMSHDQVIGLLVGFCFVKKFVDNVSVCPRPGTDTPRNLVTQVEDITNRVLDFTKATKNYEQYSPTTACGTRHRTIHLNWDMKNPVTGEMVQSDGGHSQVFAYPFECTRGFITGTYGNTDLYAHLRYDYSGTFCPTIGGDLTVPYPISVWNAIPSTVYFNPWAVTIHIDVCINNIPLVNLVTQVFDQDEDICFTLLPVTFAVDDYNINMILSLASTAGNSQLNWNHSEIASIADNVDMEIFDLVYATLHDVAPLLSKSHYEQILSSAPEDGPYWYDAGDYSPGWIANSRWSHPHEVPYNNDNFKGGKSGNDYMWLYNLYRIAYAAYPDVASVNYGEQNTCAYQSCPAIFKNITGTDLTAPTTVTRKFQNYMDFGVTIKEYLNQSLNINPVNDLNVLTELVVCNNTGGQSIVHVQNGGHLILGEPTGDNYKKGILRVSAGHKLVLKSGSTLTINDKSQVIIEPGAYIEIEPDVVIELAGADAKLDIQGTLNPITLTATHSLTITKATASVGGTAIFPNGGLHLQTNSNLYITGCTLYVEVNCPFSMEHDVNIELSDATALLEVKSNLNNINLTTGQSINVHKAASATTGGTAKFKNGSITMNNGSNVTSDFCKVYFDNTDFHYHLGSVFYINAEEALIDIKHSNYEEITLQNTDIYRVERTTEAIGGTLNLTSTSTDNGGAPSKFTHNGGGQVYSKNCRIYLNNYDYYYHPNANINLDGDMASLRFGRYVYLQPTANLTFSGTGYLGFNLIQNWGTYKNVIGDNSNTITLIGSGKTDKIVEVTSSHWVNPMDAISLITIKNGRVEFGSNALISIGSDYEYRNLEVGRIGWQWPQGTVPYGYGSGFMVGGQNVATMEDIDFYGLDFPIRAYSFWTQGADFTASNITFNNCYNGLIAWGKGFHLYNLGGSYVDNIVIGNGMETPSNIENAQYYQAETRFPVYYNTAGTSSLTIRHSTLAGDISDVSSYQGPRNSIKYEGGGLLNIRCSEINSIGDMFAGAWDNSIGMKISQGGSLNISPITGGYNAGLNKLETIAGIFFDNANAAFLNEGSNNLSSISPYYPAIVGYPSYSLSGTINNGCANYITANNNIWDYGMVSDPSVNHNYDLKTPIACSPWRNIVLTDNSPRENFCETQPPSPVDDRWALDHCPECPVIESSFFDPAPLNEALKLAMNQTVFIAGEQGDDIVAADMFYDILSISMLYDEEKINWLSNLAYSYFKETVTNAIATKRITQLDGGQKQIEKLISIISLNIERARERDNDFTEFYGYFDLASVFRIINERNQAVEILVNLPQCLSMDEGQYMYLSKTINQFTAEQMVLDGTLDIMEFDDFVNSTRVFMRYNNTQANIDTLLTDSVNAFSPVQNTQTVTDALGYSYTVSTAYDSTLNYKIVKTNAQNNIEWEQQFNGALNGIDSAKAIAIDVNSFIYVTGKSWNGLNYDIVTLKFDTAGNSYWRAVYNDLGIGNDEPTGIEVDTAFKIKINAVSYNDSVTVYKQIHYSQCDTNCAPSYRTMYKPKSNTYYLDFKVQPNPATDYAVIKITSSNKNEQYQFKLIDITGRVLINEIISDNHSLNLGSYPKGIYECILFDKDKTTKKQRLVTQ